MAKVGVINGIVKLCNEISGVEHVNDTKVTTDSLSLVFGPSFLDCSGDADYNEAVEKANIANLIAQTVILHFKTK